MLLFPLEIKEKEGLEEKVSCMDFLVRMMATTCWLSHALYELLLHHQDSVVQIVTAFGPHRLRLGAYNL
ncbi:hypothetical protein C0Q70_20877 [Pomacea canaliculata]|uniref:Uncharacterized protein n=1 Tax=Pomacea canaliculata TaxID=400727 RepID=A0A2T7NAY7_POMCA|nr:hypothetical protein C0Q70_20877 [Pomacea canaliculata]